VYVSEYLGVTHPLQRADKVSGPMPGGEKFPNRNIASLLSCSSGLFCITLLIRNVATRDLGGAVVSDARVGLGAAASVESDAGRDT
jgi:hypothetical protein